MYLKIYRFDQGRLYHNQRLDGYLQPYLTGLSYSYRALDGPTRPHQRYTNAAHPSQHTAEG